MKNFHGETYRKNFFEGWYIKNQGKDESISFIPSYTIDKQGNRSIYIQVITNTDSYCFNFTDKKFYAKDNEFYCRIGKNIFSDKGIYVDIETKKFSVKGRLYFNELKNINSDIMGPFKFIPFLQCNHGIISMRHKISGSLTVNNNKWNFDDGIGYIEMDWGTSFPKSYLWTQCNLYPQNKCSIMLSVADIPLGICNIKGCICSILYDEKEYRLATYYGVKILKYNEDEVIIKQGKYILQVNLIKKKRPLEKEFYRHKINKGYALKAPKCGKMSRTINERLECIVRYRFYREKKIVFDIINERASYETSNL